MHVVCFAEIESECGGVVWCKMWVGEEHCGCVQTAEGTCMHWVHGTDSDPCFARMHVCHHVWWLEGWRVLELRSCVRFAVRLGAQRSKPVAPQG